MAAHQQTQMSSLQLDLRVGSHLALNQLSLRWPEWTLTAICRW